MAVSEPWASSISNLLEELETTKEGLRESEARKRQIKGLNEIPRKDRRKSLRIFTSQFKNPLIPVLIGAALISYFLGEGGNATVLVAIVLLNAVLGFFQEYRAEKVLRSLHNYLTNTTKVMRNGEPIEIDSRHLVVGDVLHLSIGDIVPADSRLISCEGLSVDESTLTGESEPTHKKQTKLDTQTTLLRDQINMLFMGTTISSGSATAVVVRTGSSTIFSKTVGYTLETPPSRFQKDLTSFSRMLLGVVAVMVGVVFFFNAVLGKGILESFMFAVAFAIGITPEALPIVMTITLSGGARLMAKRKVIVKKLAAIEELGNMDVLCCDKTGTLTEGEVKFHGSKDLSGRSNRNLVLRGMLCNSGHGGRGRHSFGNPIDKAMWKSGDAEKLSSELTKFKSVKGMEFDFDRRRMSVLVEKDGKKMLIAKGAPESILRICSHFLLDGVKKMTPKKIKEFSEKAKSYEEQGYVTIAIAETKSGEKEENMTLLGFLLFLDPPKRTIKSSLNTIRKLDIKLKVISGDSPEVTEHICKEVGINILGRIVTGNELEGIHESRLRSFVENYNVFARVTPEQKYLLVKALKENHVVGFLGDGVNDAPAIKLADVGISVNTATGVAKDSSDIILLKKSLKVLSEGIIEGRKTFANITKYILNTISGNYGNMFTIAFSSLFIPFIPLLPVQILLNNFISDIPLLTISADSVDIELLKKPKKWDTKMISGAMTRFGIISSFYDMAFIIPIFIIFGSSVALFRTSWFLESLLSELFVVFSLRTVRPAFKSKPGFLLLTSTLLVTAFSILITSSSIGAELFEFVAIPPVVLAYTAVVIVAYFLTDELAKKSFFEKFGP